jgi:UTP--glucose-1-phosphate uridylyltransferase
MGRVRTAVFPVAGFGTRFLPATKAMPKVLLPVVDRPLIQYAVDEALASGIESLIFVTGRGHAAIEDYFDVSYELERELVDRGRADIASWLASLRPADPGQFAFVRQMEPLGLGHAVWCARNLIGNDPFAVLLADELIVGEPPCLQQLVDVHESVGGNVVLVDEVDPATTERYGIIESAGESGGAIRVSSVVEKPPPGEAPSNLALIGRYVLEPSVMDILGDTDPGAGGEIQLTDAIRSSIATSSVHAVRATGKRYDCGSPEGFLEATIELAYQREDLAPAMRRAASRIMESNMHDGGN